MPPRWILLVLPLPLLASLARSEVAPTPAPAPAAPAPARIHLEFDNKPWPEILQWLADQLGLTLVMQDPPVGKFTYKDPIAKSTDEAFEILHRALLDRGFTLARKPGQLLVLLLADNLQWSFAPYVERDDLARRPPTEFVTTTLALNALPGREAARELGPTLSPRGKIAGTALGNRVAVCDQAGVLVQLVDLLRVVDPPNEGRAIRLKVFRLEHANGESTVRLVKELIGPPPSSRGGGGGGGGGGPPGGMPDGMAAMLGGMPDFEQMGQQLFNRQTLSSLVPGMSFKGVVSDAPKKATETRIALDRASNSLLVTGSPEALALVAKVIAGLDVPAVESDLGAAEVAIRRYQIPGDGAGDLAARLRDLFGREAGFAAAGTSDSLIVKGTAAQHQRIERILERLDRAQVRLAAFPVAGRDLDALVAQLERLFGAEGDGENGGGIGFFWPQDKKPQTKPRFVADAATGHLLVRGTERQIEEVRRFLAELAAPDRIGRPAQAGGPKEARKP